MHVECFSKEHYSPYKKKSLQMDEDRRRKLSMYDGKKMYKKRSTLEKKSRSEPKEVF